MHRVVLRARFTRAAIIAHGAHLQGSGSDGLDAGTHFREEVEVSWTR